jgi:hypothetical protein
LGFRGGRKAYRAFIVYHGKRKQREHSILQHRARQISSCHFISRLVRLRFGIMKAAPIFLFFATTLLIIGCETGPPLTTTSGRPEVFIANAAPGRVRAAIIDRGMSRGWTLERETENTITFVTKSNNVMASVLLSSNYDPNVMDRLRFTTISVNGGTKVYATEELVSNHGSAFERVTPLQNNKNSNALQGS